MDFLCSGEVFSRLVDIGEIFYHPSLFILSSNKQRFTRGYWLRQTLKWPKEKDKWNMSIDICHIDIPKRLTKPWRHAPGIQLSKLNIIGNVYK